jgi:hypothetical protein
VIAGILVFQCVFSQWMSQWQGFQSVEQMLLNDDALQKSFGVQVDN